MKKALSFVSVLAGSIMTVGAQVGSVATQGQIQGAPLTGLVALAQKLVAQLVPFAVGLAVLVFFWYMIMYIVKGNSSAEDKSTSLKGMGYSILALFVMVSIWGIIGLIGSMLGIGQGGLVPIPGIPVPAP